MRHFVPPEEKLFTWWSYRSPDWTVNDRGRRLDHIWVTPDLTADARGDQRAERRARLGSAVRPRSGDRVVSLGHDPEKWRPVFG